MADPNDLNARLRKKYGIKSSEPQPSLNDRLRKKYSQTAPSDQPVTFSEPPGPGPSPDEIKTQTAAAVAYPELEKSIIDLRRELYDKIASEGPLSEEEVNRRVEEEVKRRLPKPIYAGNFSLSRPQAPAIPSVAPSALATPLNLPSSGPSFTELLGAQTRAPERAAREASIFNDVNFEKSITELPRGQQILERGAYEGLKEVYKKIKSQKEGISEKDAIQEARSVVQSVNDAMSGKISGGFTQTPPQFRGPTGEEGGLLETPKVTPGREMFVPNDLQSIFLNKFNTASKASRRFQAEEDLKEQKFPGAPGAAGMVITRNLSEDERKQKLDELEKGGAFDAPMEFQPQKMQEFMADPEKFATGGIIFDKEYPSGLVIESPTNQLLRIVTAPLNAIAGAIGGVAKQLMPGLSLEEVSAARPEKLRGTGIKENIIANIQDMGGYTKEGYEIGQYNKYLKDTPAVPLLTGIGFGVDLSGVGDISLIKGAAGAARGAVAGAAAARAAKAPVITAALKTGTAEAGSSFLKEVPFLSKYAKGADDVRLVYGNMIGRSLVDSGEMKSFENTIDEIAVPGAKAKSLQSAENLKNQILAEVKSVDNAISNNTKRIDDATKEIDDAGETLSILNEDLNSYKSNKIELETALKSDPRSVALKQKLDSITNFLARKEEQIKKAESELRSLTKKNKDEVKLLKTEIDELGTKKEKLFASQKSLTEGSDIKALEADIKKTISGNYDLSSISDLLPVAIKMLSQDDTDKIVVLAKRLKRDKNLKTSSLLQEIQSVIPDVYAKLKSQIVEFAALERGIIKIDDSLSRLGLKGADISAVTPKTLATKGAAEQIIGLYKKTPFYQDVIVPLQETTPLPYFGKAVQRDRAIVEGKLVDQIKITPDQVDTIKATVITAGNRLDKGVAENIYRDIEKGTINPSDLRELSYAVTDIIATAKNKGISRNVLSAEIGSSKVGASVRTGGLSITERGAQQINVERRFEELTSDYPVIINRIRRNIQKTLDPIESFVDERSKGIISNAKSRLSKMNEELRSELQAAKQNPDIAKALGIDSKTATNNEIIVALATEGGTRSSRFAEHLLDSMVYQTNKNPIITAVMAQYDWGKGVLTNKKEYEELLARVSKQKPKEMILNLPDTFAQMQRIVENDVNLEIKAAGGKTIAVPKELSTDVLLAAYARKKCDDIIAESLESVMSKERIEISSNLSFLEEVRRRRNIPNFDAFINTVYQMAAGGGDAAQYISSLIAKSTVDPDAVKNALELLPRKLSPGMKDFMEQEIKSAINNTIKTGEIDGVLKDILMVSDAYKSYTLQDILPVMDLLITEKVPIDRFVSPELVMQVKRDLSSATEYKKFLNEVGRLSDLAANGNKSAFGAMNVISEAWKIYNKGFYDLVLTLNPRFHGPNFLGGPLQIAYTTGRYPIMKNPLKNYFDAINTVVLSKSPENIRRNAVAVVDKLGNTYTHGDLYDLALKSGVFKSQFRAIIPKDITTEMKELVEPSQTIGGKASRLYEAPPLSPSQLVGTPLASMSDDVHRMTVVIDALRSGDTLENALALGRRSLFDYGEITGVEKMIATRFFVFYTFWRQTIVEFVKNLVKDPLRMGKGLQLAPTLTRTSIGDQKADDLAFYYPPEWGAGRVMMQLEPASKYNGGRSIAMFPMPQNDALNFWGQALVSPMSLLTGPQEVGLENSSDFQESVLAARLGPGTNLGINLARGKWFGEQEIKNNRIPIEHAAIYHAVGLEPILRKFMPSLQWIPAGEGSRSATFDDMTGPMELYIDDEDSKFYAKYIKTLLQFTGAGRQMSDRPREVGGALGIFNGPYPKTWPEYLGQLAGIITTSGAASPSTAELKVIRQQAREIDERTKELKERRLPKQ